MFQEKGTPQKIIIFQKMELYYISGSNFQSLRNEKTLS